MATSGGISKIVAGATGVVPETVLLNTRILREAGLLTVGGRGSNAPAMTTRDAARLVIALLTTDRPSDGPEAVREFGQLRRATGGVPTEEGDHRFQFQPAGRFEDALAALLEALAALPDFEAPPKIIVAANVNELLCTIEVQGLRYSYLHSSLRDKADQKTDSIEPFVFALREQYRKSRIRVRREIGTDVLVPIADNFRKGGTP
jgi:hypothetical protein